jgi:hypothetical protein
MAEYAKWSGEALSWPDLAAWIREASDIVEQRKAAGDPSAQRPAVLAFAVCRRIISHFMGDEWFKRNAMLGGRADRYLNPEFADESPHATAPLYTVRLFNIAECLFNLQYKENFKSPVLGLLDEDNIEAAVAEFQLGLGVWSRNEMVRVDLEDRRVFGPGLADDLVGCSPS